MFNLTRRVTSRKADTEEIGNSLYASHCEWLEQFLQQVYDDNVTLEATVVDDRLLKLLFNK